MRQDRGSRVQTVPEQEGSGAPSLLWMPRSLGRSWGSKAATPNQQVND